MRDPRKPRLEQWSDHLVEVGEFVRTLTRLVEDLTILGVRTHKLVVVLAALVVVIAKVHSL